MNAGSSLRCENPRNAAGILSAPRSGPLSRLSKRRAVQRLLLVVLASFGLWTSSAQAQERFDILIRGARVFDGSGNPWFAADIGVRQGRIAAVGQLPGAAADLVLDGAGRYVSPGFIDIHSHADDNTRSFVPRPTIRTDSLHRKAAPNIVSQGVTTIVVNQDGRSAWPISEQRAVLERQGIGPNVMLLIGHGTVRGLVLGDDHRRRAEPDEVREMAKLVAQGMEEGAAGISAGLEYVPGRWSDTDEVARLVRELAPYDGVYISHQRAEGADPMWFLPSRDAPGAPTLQDAILETIEIGRRTGVKVVASHIKAKGVHWWGSSNVAIQLIEAARSEGVRVWADQYPYPTSGSDGRTVLLPGWALADPDAANPGEARPPAEMLEARLADSELRERIHADIVHEIRRRGGASRVLVFEHPNAKYVGASLLEIARMRGEDEVAASIALQLEGDRRVPGGGRMRGFSMSEEDVEAYGARPWVATASDGGLGWPGDGPVHPRFYGTFTRKIRHYALNRGALSLEAAIRSQTSLPARIMGLSDRGMIRVGNWADLVVFDLETIADNATFTDPHQHSTGIDHVLVNGRFVLRDGEVLMETPGQVLASARSGATDLDR